MVNSAVYNIQDIYPLSIQLIDEQWEPVREKDYVLIKSDDQATEVKKTNEKGFVSAIDLEIGGRIKLVQPEVKNVENAQPEIGSEEKQAGGELGGDDLSEPVEYLENPGPLPVLDLRDRSGGGKGPLRKNDSRRSLVEQLQRMLNYLDYYLGKSGPEEDGVDGLYQDRTYAAVKKFQRAHKDWDGKQLRVDGIVGPRTGDALNRELVGIWYSKYETPEQLTSGCKLVVMTEDFAMMEGVSIG